MAHLKPEERSCKLQLKWKSAFQELEEAQEFCAEAARASQALAKAEAERELLQQLLKEKEEQVGCLLCSMIKHQWVSEMSCLEVLALPFCPQVVPNQCSSLPWHCPRTNWRPHCLEQLSFNKNNPSPVHSNIPHMRAWQGQLCAIEWELFVI